MKKRMHNSKRSKAATPPEPEENRVEEKPPGEDEVLVKHLQTALSLIEGRKVSRQEILELVRQHSIDQEEEDVYPADDPDKTPG
jgi:hypothetical protein